MNSTEAQTQQEMVQIISVVQELTGLTSRWSGRVELVPDAPYMGQKSFACHVSIRASLAQEQVRWATLIHEAFHSVSAGFNREDFRNARGWEEGVVEQLQRLFRVPVLDRLGVSVNDVVFAESEGKHLYNPYIEHLEDFRQLLNDDLIDFYLGLLRTPIKSRASQILNRGMAESHLSPKAFVLLFSAANATMRDKVKGEYL